MSATCHRRRGGGATGIGEAQRRRVFAARRGGSGLAHVRRPVAVSTPLLGSLRGYRRQWARFDLLAAAALLVIAIPEQLATSRLAGMPPITGFYAFIAGTAAFALLGSNPQLSVGADSTIAPLFAVGLARFAASDSPRYIDLAGILAVEVGVIVVAVGLLRLGWIAELLSAPIITGFLAGVAVIIAVHQLPDLIGVPGTGGSTINRLRGLADQLGAVNGWTLGLGCAVLGFVALASRVDRRIPAALVGLVGSTVAVGLLDLRSHGVAVLGSFAHGAPRIGLSGLSWTAIGDVAPIAGVVALVVLSQSAVTTRAFADRGDYEIDVNRDFIGVGAGNVVAGMFGSFAVDASPPRTAAVASSSGRTQLAGLAAAAAMVALIPAAGLLRDLPLAMLAAVLLVVAAGMFHLSDLRRIARFDLFELGLALVTLLTVALIGVEQGIGVAIGLAVADRTRLSARPQLHVLGRLPGSTSWVPLSGVERAAQLPGVLVVLFATPLWYANAVHFRRQLRVALGRAAGTPRLVVLDTIGMTDIDYTGTVALRRAIDELERDGAAFAIARAGQHVSESLRRSGLLERIGADHCFASVDEAVTALAPHAALS